MLAERPKFPNAVFNRGVVLQAIGRRSDALAAFQRFLAIVPASDPRAGRRAKSAIAELGG